MLVNLAWFAYSIKGLEN